MLINKQRFALMKQRLISIILFVIVSLILLPADIVQADSTVLSTHIPETVILSIEMSGDGCVIIDGESYYRSAQIEIQRNTPVMMSVLPNSSSTLQEIEFSEYIERRELDSSSFEISLGLNGSIEILFEINHEGITENPSANTADTGDDMHIFLWTIVCFLALVVLVVLWKQKYCGHHTI